MTENATFDSDEIAKFDLLAANWWDLTGELRTLHALNPVRLQFIQLYMPLAGKKILDIGCGGGILSESLAKAGAIVTSIDLSPSLIEVAKQHALEQELVIDYQHIDLESFVAQNTIAFDGIVCMELLEHVPDPAQFIQQIKLLVTDQSHLFFSTINRTPKAYWQAIITAEYILQLLPKKTHDYANFIKPSELANWLRQSDLIIKDIIGVNYNPLTHQASIKEDVAVNYMVHAVSESTKS